MIDRRARFVAGVVLFVGGLVLAPAVGLAQTAQGEIEDRAAPVGRRGCLGGGNAGALCNESADCPGSTCKDRNVFNLSVAVHYDAPAGDLTALQDLITEASAVILDVTDGQAEIGQATIHNNAFGTSEADLRVYPATCTAGSSIGAVCEHRATNVRDGTSSRRAERSKPPTPRDLWRPGQESNLRPAA